MIRARWLLPVVVFLLVVVAGLHGVATVRHWYWVYSWFDLILHFLGGLWAALATVWVARTTRLWGAGGVPRNAWVWIFAATLAAGLAWEIYEYLVGMVFVDKGGYLEDTLADLAMDLLGGSPVAIAVSRPGPVTPLQTPDRG